MTTITFDQTKSIVLIAGALFVGWKVYQVNRAANEVIDAVDNSRVEAGRSIGRNIYNFLNPRPDS